MDVKNSVAVVAALLAFSVGGAAVATADEGNNDNGTATTATGQSVADEQQSGEQGDVENTDLATEVEEADGANNQDGVNEEDEVGDGADGDVDDGPEGDTEGDTEGD